MALPGMRSTADYAADQRPKNYREGILLRTPRNNAPLYALTSMMKSSSTDDPEFYWWEEDTQMFAYTISADITNVATTVNITAGATQLKPGDVLRFDDTGEAIQVISVVSDTQFTCTRALGPGGSAAGTAAAHTTASNNKLLFIGSAFREGAPRSIGTSNNPSKKSNVTQIFRDPVEWTRTATKTRTRTGDEMKNDRRRILHKHSIAIERSFWLGTRFETLESGQPKRMTDGLISFVPSTNVKTVTAGGVDMDELESYFAGIFAYGSGEKLAFGSISTITIINQIIRKNTSYQWEPGGKEYGMDVTRLRTPAGTLVLTEHPLFGQAGQFLAEDLFILDTENLGYRYITDTTLLKDRQDKGQDGIAEEYLTEAGLEVHHGSSFYWLKGIKKAAIDD